MTTPLRRLAPLLVLLAAGPAWAQVPTPEAFLGYDLGERFTPHHRVMDYVEAVAAASPRVTIEPYGETPEGRPLVTLTVAAEGTDVEAVRRSHLAATEGGGPPQKAVVWLSYNVHGNEAVSTEAALRTLYELTTPRADAWLRDVVVVLDPCLNPDGRDRYVVGYRQRRGDAPDADPDGWEHDEPWPGGRFNHYLFDLNRDWAWGTQPETRARLAVYNRWMPAVHVDFHEQGVDSPYYFAPAAEPFHPRIAPWQRELQTVIGRANARVFDREGRLYFTREVFDLFYPGYGDTWPTFNGAVGMTYEQGGSGRAGLAIETAEGDTLRLADRIENHVATGLETVATVAREADRVRTEFAALFATPPEGPAVAFAARGDAGRLRALADLLDLQGIAYGWAGREQTARGVRYAGGLDRPAPAGRVVIEAGDLVVPLDQPKGRLAAVLFEPEPALSDSVTYDVTAWALPYVYGVEGLALEEPVDAGGAAPAAPAPPPEGRPYAYVLPWSAPQDARALAALLRAGVGVRVAPEPFEAEGRRFERGAVVATRAGNGRLGSRFDDLVRDAMVGRPVVALGTGFATAGADLGSNRVGFTRAPSVAALTDEPVSPTALGEVWHWFDRVADYPLTLLRAEAFSRADLDGVDVLVMPDGGYGSWLTDDRAGVLRDWVRSGGRLVALERAATAFAGKDGFGIAVRKAPEADSTAEARLRRYADREREGVSRAVPGAVFRVALDETHPLAYGYPAHTYVIKRRTNPVDFLADGWNVGVLRSGTPAAGFAGRGAQDRLEDSLVFGVEDVGRGQVVYLVDDPIYRGFWADGHLLFANAVFGLGTE